jgi:hypothetical protein
MPSISILTTPEAFLARIEPFDRLDPKTRRPTDRDPRSILSTD